MHKQSKSGRKISKRTDDNNPIICLINQAMGKGDLSMLADRIGFHYQNLWAVYQGNRKMPIIPLYALCKIVGIDADGAIHLYAEQPKPTKPQPPAPDSVEATTSDSQI